MPDQHQTRDENGYEVEDRTTGEAEHQAELRRIAATGERIGDRFKSAGMVPPRFRNRRG